MKAMMNGRINEKALRSATNHEGLGNLLHSVFGLDHYPDYLKRWDVKSIESLESQLEQTLKKVQEQKAKLALRHSLMEDYIPQMQMPGRIEDIFDPRFAKYIHAGRLQAGRALELLAEERSEEVFSFPLLNPLFCEQLLREGLRAHSHLQKSIASLQSQLQQEESSSSSSSSSSSTNNVLFPKHLLEEFMSNISVLDWSHLGWVNDALLEYAVSPLSKLLYPAEGNILDWRHGYIISYSAATGAAGASASSNMSSQSSASSSAMEPSSSANLSEGDHNKITSHSLIPPRNHLVNHTDDSEVTLSVCLGSDGFTGGDIVFKEYRSDTNEATTVVKPRIGAAILHRGRQAHAVLPVQTGDRHMLIMWARNLENHRAVTCPCCWMNARKDGGCICGPMWN